MSLIVPNLSITNFRMFRKLDVGPFGRVNLITGKNNSGKSSLLEAIRILVTEGSATVFFDIFKNREEVDPRLDDLMSSFTPKDVSMFCSLFPDFPALLNCKDTIKICNQGENPSHLVTINLAWAVNNPTFSGMAEKKVIDADSIENEKLLYAMVKIDSKSDHYMINIDFIRDLLNLFSEKEPSPACVFLDPSSSKLTGQLGALWDKITLTDTEDEVVQAMRIISSDIQKISMIGNNGGSNSRTVIAKSSKYDHPVPLRSFGDGVNRLFGLILSLACAKGGVLLVDEIENGFHYSILPDVWRAIYRIATALDVQVFATTHSWDCIEAFQIASSEHPEEGILTRLTVKGDRIIPTTFYEDDLRIITRDRIEIR